MERDAGATAASNEETKAFIGRNYGYFFDKWEFRENSWYKGWNFTAMVFAIEWMAYRKMYKEAFFNYLFAISFTFIIAFILNAMGIWFAISIMRDVFRLFAGAIANALYYKKVKREVENFINMDGPERFDYLQTKGGVSFVGLIVCIALQVVGIFILLLVQNILLLQR